MIMSKFKEHMIRMLLEYAYQKELYIKNKELSEEYERRIKEEQGVRSRPFDSIPGHNPTDYEKELINEQYGYYLESKRAKQEMDRIWQKEHFTERFKVLLPIERTIIEMRYFERKSQEKIAIQLNYSDKTYISKKENKALRKMIRVKID